MRFAWKISEKSARLVAELAICFAIGKVFVVEVKECGVNVEVCLDGHTYTSRLGFEEALIEADQKAYEAVLEMAKTDQSVQAFLDRYQHVWM